MTSMPKAACRALAEHVLLYPHEFTALLELIETGSDVQAMKGSWVVAHIRLSNPVLSEGHQQRILRLACNAKIGGVRRELLRSLEGIRLEPAVMDELLEYTLQWICDMEQDFAVRYLSYRIVLACSKTIPELKQELQLIKQMQLEKVWQIPVNCELSCKLHLSCI